VNASKLVIEAELAASDEVTHGSSREATRIQWMAVAKADEHVLGLNAPIVEDGPFDAAMALTCRWRNRPQHQLRTLVGAAGTAASCQRGREQMQQVALLDHLVSAAEQ
jgi:hypothetical protein